MSARPEAYGTAEPAGWYLAGLGLVALLCVRLLPETSGADLTARPHADTGRRRAAVPGTDPAV